jgi:hypothetical protein
LVLSNVGLLEDLRESRRRLVAAQDLERRKLERNIHDGSQQQLVALAVKLRLARSVLEKDPARVDAMLDELASETQQALEDLRDLARGIYPPLLADQGLGAALDARRRAGRAGPVTVEADGVGRYAPESRRRSASLVSRGPAERREVRGCDRGHGRGLRRCRTGSVPDRRRRRRVRRRCDLVRDWAAGDRRPAGGARRRCSRSPRCPSGTRNRDRPDRRCPRARPMRRWPSTRRRPPSRRRP